MNTLIVGVGTGRCGTKSLARLLDLQDSTFATHERYGPRVRWNCPPNLWPYRLWDNSVHRDYDFVCDVAFYWTPHIKTFLDWGTNSGRRVRIVGLKRDVDETVNSYDKWKPNSDHWSYHGYRETKPDEWDKCYPHFQTDDKREGIRKFWHYTYKMIENFAERDNRVKLFESFDCFNTEKGVKSILDFCGFESPVVESGITVRSPNSTKSMERIRQDMGKDSMRSEA